MMSNPESSRIFEEQAMQRIMHIFVSVLMCIDSILITKQPNFSLASLKKNQ